MSKHDSIEQFLNEITFEIERQADNPNYSLIELKEAFKTNVKHFKINSICECTKLAGTIFYIWKKIKNRNNAICLRNIKIMPEVSD
jgi:hypothetical protein